jgi:RNA polymerase sigma-70 factor (ECF subfamily)
MSDDSTVELGGGRGPATRPGFPATRWSVVFRAQGVEGPDSAQALAEICRLYWQPVYSFLRRQGNKPQDAEDLTQGFFLQFLERRSLSTVEESRGKLRSFVLVALKRYAANEYQRSMAGKRGGSVPHISIDREVAEQTYSAEPFTNLSPDLLFEKQWAITLLESVLEKLRAEYLDDGRERTFEALKDRISADASSVPLAKVGADLGMTEGAVKVAVFRLRQRYRRLLHEQIALTVDDPEDIREEILHLFKVFGSDV